jgi:hypothetical protein
MNGRSSPLPYLPTMCMGNYLQFVIAPEFDLLYSDGTVLAKVHTADLRVVFNNECSGRQLKELLADNCDLFVEPWNDDDPSTKKSLIGNALITSAAQK